jgi:Mg2+ and Co2+ transporter CorA
LAEERKERFLRIAREGFREADRKIDAIAKAIERCTQKIARIRRSVAERAQAASGAMETSKWNLWTLLKVGRNASLIRRVVDQVAPRLGQHATQIRRHIEQEQEDDARGDGEMSLSDLRKAIIRLLREIYVMNNQAEREAEANERERKRLMDEAKQLADEG